MLISLLTSISKRRYNQQNSEYRKENRQIAGKVDKMLDNRQKIEYRIIMDCSLCQHYQCGRGQPACLNCKQYQKVKKLSIKRQTIKYEHIPDAILENIADTPQYSDIIDIIHKMTPQHTMILLSYYVGQLTHQQIADNLHCDRSKITKKIAEANEIITQIMKSGT
ncbi:MAG: antiterminator Q family protein [Candidatus Pacebacteria bacterium]|nr:antiterminator Q family protein [Candidatus Paceibacterota bacterium]